MLQVVGRAVERIDDPRAIALSRRRSRLLAEEGITGRKIADAGDDCVLALAIGGGDPVVARFDIRVVFSEVFPVVEKDFGAAAGSFGGDLDVVQAALF